MKAACIVLGSVTLAALLATCVPGTPDAGSAPQPTPVAENLRPPEPQVVPAEPDRPSPPVDNHKPKTIEVRLSENEILQLTESLTQHYDQIGKYWMNVLDDEDNDNASRVKATKALGQMKYNPAIPVLIKHIRLHDDSILGYTESGIDFPASQALGQYGNAAVPQIVNAYLDDKDRKLSYDYLGSIWAGRTMAFAKTYLLGLQVLQDNRIVSSDFEHEYFK